MRVIFSRRVHVPVEGRAMYFAAFAEYAKTLRDEGLVKGTYVMESVDEPGVMIEFLEFADHPAVRVWREGGGSPKIRELEAQLRALRGPAEEGTLWDQRV